MVDLNSMFEGLTFDSVEEAALGAGQKYSQVRCYYIRNPLTCGNAVCYRH